MSDQPATDQPDSDQAKILRCGDRAICVELSRDLEEAVNRRVIALADDLSANPVRGMTELTPSYRSLLIRFDPLETSGAKIGEAALARLAALSDAGDAAPGRLWRLPVVYGGEGGEDLEELARMKDLSTAELIALHSGAEYRVYMIGFSPGFAYLGGLPEQLHTPRLATPRQLIPAGAAGIGGRQANVNSVPGPSGWRYLGVTPVRIFDAGRENPFLLRAGDRIRFTETDAAEAGRITAAQEKGETVITPEEGA